MHRSIRHTLLVLTLMPVLAFAADNGGLSWRKDGVEPDPAKRVQAKRATTVAQAQPVAAPQAAQQPAAEVAAAEEAQTAAEPVAAAEPAAAAAPAAGGPIGTPPSGKGQIVFFRPSKFAGGAIGFKVREGQTELGKLRSGKYFVAVVEPGQHQYTVHSEAEDVLTLEVEAGETYYVQGTINMGFLVGRPNLSPSDALTFNGMASKLKLAQ